MVIQHNIPALNSHRNMGINTAQTSKNLEKLSSGFKINRAGDDAAGLAISEKMRGQIRGLSMAEQNASNGVSLIQTAEGGLNETHSILQRMRELAVQSSNGTYQDEDRAQIELEYQALKSEIDRIASYTNYNGIKLLDGTVGGVKLNNTSMPTAADLQTFKNQLSAYDTALANWNADMKTYQTYLSTAATADTNATTGGLTQADLLGTTTDAFVGWGKAFGKGGDLAADAQLTAGGAATDVDFADAQLHGEDLHALLGFSAIVAADNLTVQNDTGATIAIGDELNLNFTWDKDSSSWTITGALDNGDTFKAVGVKAGDTSAQMYLMNESGSGKSITLNFGAAIGAIDPRMDTEHADGISFDYDIVFATAAVVDGDPSVAANTTQMGDAAAVTVTAGNLKGQIPTGADVDLQFDAKIENGKVTGWKVGVTEADGSTVAPGWLEQFDTNGIVFDSATNSISLRLKDIDTSSAATAADRARIIADNTLTIQLDGKFMANLNSQLAATAAAGPVTGISFKATGFVVDADAADDSQGGGGTAGVGAALTIAPADIVTTRLVADTNVYRTAGFGAAAIKTAVKPQAPVPPATIASNSPDAKRADAMLASMGISYASDIKMASDEYNGKDAYILTRKSVVNGAAYPTTDSYNTLLQVGDKTFLGTLTDNTWSFKDSAGKEVATLSNAKAATETGSIRFNIGSDGQTASSIIGKENAMIGASNGSELVFQIGANGAEDQRVGMYVLNMSTNNLGNHAKGEFVSESTIVTRDQANTAVNTLDAAINYVSDQRANLGALQNRLEHTLNNLGVTKENLTAAESSIRDVDMAKEMMEFTKNNILVQASQAMLAQANQLPQGVLQLLR